MVDIVMSEKLNAHAGTLRFHPGSELLMRARRGDKQAFMDLFAAHDRRIYSLALRTAGDVDGAENLTRDIFVQAFGNLNTVRDEADFARSLYRTAVKNCLSAIHRVESSAPQCSGCL